jgi:predicted phosphodiesterase
LIYLTGDTHIPIDIEKLNQENFKEQELLDENDYLIVCGDFGLIWAGLTNKIEEYWTKWLNAKKFNILFIDGNHENFSRLDNYPVKEWNGGKVHVISKNIFHLMRGQVFTLEGKKIFTLGGASSHDKETRQENISWWERELPNYSEIIEATDNLEKNDYKVDYIITHCMPSSLIPEILTKEFIQYDSLTNFLDMVKDTVEFKRWYCGHYHTDYNYTDFPLTVLYDQIIPLGETAINYEK